MQIDAENKYNYGLIAPLHPKKISVFKVKSQFQQGKLIKIKDFQRKNSVL